MSDPIEAEVVEIDGAPPPPRTPEPRPDWFRFDRRIARPGPSPLSWILGGLLAVLLLLFGLLALAGFAAIRTIQSLLGLFRPRSGRSGNVPTVR